jgi:hypothetical protein
MQHIDVAAYGTCLRNTELGDPLVRQVVHDASLGMSPRAASMMGVIGKHLFSVAHEASQEPWCVPNCNPLCGARRSSA